jgi:hypothetical protein
MLGAGFVTRPTLDILTESGIAVTVGMQSIMDLSLYTSRVNALTIY